MKHRLPLLAALAVSPLGAAPAPDSKPGPEYFVNEVIAENLRDPIECAPAPDGRVFIVGREGHIWLCDPAARSTRLLTVLPVTHLHEEDQKSDFAREDGLNGIALAPDFATTGNLFLYYSPKTEKSEYRLSRFTFRDGNLDLSSEKILLTVHTERDKRTCHHGGSLAFDRHGNLLLTTGDNTNPFESDGSSPSDARSDRTQWDALRSAGNTNDLRGKVLRITPKPDGTYSIPAGNLFPPGTALTRPEIYVMGCRNPYRIAADPARDTIYWGEVGPDAGDDSKRGSRGFDEVNQARRAGNHGWPLFIGDSQPYVRYNFDTKELGEKNNPQKPVNWSPRNTGLKELPPVVPAFIWYPYKESEKFPLLGTGGRNAMAGPVLRAGHGVGDAPGLLPKYFDSKLFTYDWMRSKIWLVSLDAQENYAGMEVWRGGLKHPMDFELAKDGSLFLLEYGTNWYFNNDGRLTRIRFAGWNLPPVAKLSASAHAVALPGKVDFSAKGSSDPEKTALTYAWDFNGDGKADATGSEVTKTFDTAGRFPVTLTVTDADGRSATASTEVIAGNTVPTVKLELAGNPKTFAWGSKLAYKVSFDDAEDRAANRLDPARVRVEVEFDADGQVPAEDALPGGLPDTAGAALIKANNCFSCHQVGAQSVGPAYLAVAAKYVKQPNAADYLAGKILSGGVDVWGHTPMPPQVQLKKEQTLLIADTILSLAKSRGTVLTGASGEISAPPRPSDDKAAAKGALVITAIYEDQGLPGVGTLIARQRLVLKVEDKK